MTDFIVSTFKHYCRSPVAVLDSLHVHDCQDDTGAVDDTGTTVVQCYSSAYYNLLAHSTGTYINDSAGNDHYES